METFGADLDFDFELDDFVGQDILEELNFDVDTSITEQPVMFAGTAGQEKQNNNQDSFDFERWDIHRSPTRYFRLLYGLFAGITTKRITPTVIYILLWSSCIDLYNAIESNYGLPEVELPITPFELAGPVLGLLLVFRSNTAFERFNVGSDATWEITGRFKSIIRQLLSFTSARRTTGGYSKDERIAAYELVDACFILHGWILCDYLRKSTSSNQNNNNNQNQSSQNKQKKILQKALALPSDITQQLWTRNDNNNNDDDNNESSNSRSNPSNSNPSSNSNSQSLRNLLRKQQEQQYYDDYHQSPSALINIITLGIMTRIPTLDPEETTCIEEQFVEIISSLGTCEKLLRTPIPLGYTRYSVRFVMIWLTLLPFALVRTFAEFGTNTWWEGRFQPVLVIAMIFLSVVFLSIEDISVQIEEPFCILPLDLHHKWLKRDIVQMKRTSKLVDGIYNNNNVNNNNEDKKIPTTSSTTSTTTKENNSKKERRLRKFGNRLRSLFTNTKNHKNDNNES
jgi:predicted membrane chloride channel (bestrophin family)